MFYIHNDSKIGWERLISVQLRKEDAPVAHGNRLLTYHMEHSQRGVMRIT